MMDKKLNAVRFGQWGEGLACLSLRLKGYKILKRNFRSAVGEIDIIAKKGKTLCFIEVKSRPTERLALECLSARQQKRIILATQAFLSFHPRYSHHTIRFDFFAITPYGWPLHIKNAWCE
ncbi:YraN family protein [Candidatus Terasakiella magnetica]|nr:YraN family protein [Candidatus Terasakiella magnetica]